MKSPNPSPEQEKVISAYLSNGWKVDHQLSSGIIQLSITDVNPETEKETPLKAYIDPDGSSRIV